MNMYGTHGHVVTASMVPLSVGALFTAGWIVMAVITIVFLVAALAQLVRPATAEL
jgi:hypothetical protein